MIRQLKRRRYKHDVSTKYYIDCAKYAEHVGEIHIEGILQDEISVLHAAVQTVRNDDTIHRKDCHIVVKIDINVKTNRKEFNIGERIFQSQIPGFMRYTCIFPFYDTNVLVMPYLSEGSIANYVWDESTLPILKCLLMQTVMSSLNAYTNLRFLHVNLHLGNILIRKTTSPEIEYVIGTETYSVPTMGYQIVMTDFGNSMLYIKDEDSIFYWVDMLNVFSRINLDLVPSQRRKIIWNDEHVIHFINRARDTDAPPIDAIQLLNLIHQTTFCLYAMPTIATHFPDGSPSS